MKIAGANPLGHVGYWAAALVIVVMGWVLYDATLRTEAVARRIDHSLEVLERITAFKEALARANSAQRGFLLYGGESFAAERETAVARAHASLAEMRGLTEGDESQQERAAAISRLLDLRAGAMRQMAARHGSDPAVAGANANQYTAAMTDLAAQARGEELEHLALSRLESRQVYDNAIRIVIVAVVVALGVMLPGYVAFVREARARSKAQRQLQDLADSLPGAVVQYRVYPDGGKRYEFLSNSVAKMRGVDREAALRDPEVILSTIVEGDREKFLAALAEGARTMTPVEHDYRIRDGKGGVRWMRTSAAPRKDEDGSIVWSAHWGDVTEKRMLDRELAQSREAAEAANRAKSAFLATMSHEIRTPMNGVLGMLELLALTRLDAEQRTTLEVVRQSSRSLLRIIDDILDFSKIEAGKLELRPEAASVEDIVARVRNVYAGNASSKGLVLTHSVDGRISPAVRVDPVRLQQILANLVSNAIKFTSQGEVAIRAELLERGDDEDVVRFAVEDTGIGVSPTEQARLFEPFSQVGGGSPQRYGGTGLGLSICQRLASLMGATIEMQSEPGVGTTMELRMSLPIADPRELAASNLAHAAAPALPVAAREAPSVEHAARDGTLVLIVDDHPINRMVLQRQVNALGYAAATAEDGLEALDRWNTGEVGVIITDCNMPEMNGYQLAREIRACEARNGHVRTPVIACTANAIGGEAEKCFEAGMDDYLAKPIDLRRLGAMLSRWLPLAGLPAARDAAGAPCANPIEPAVLAEISAGDSGLEREIVLRFHGFNQEDVELLHRALEHSDIDLVTHASHRIKGASKTVGAMALAQVCDRLERAGRSRDWKAVADTMRDFQHELGRLNDYVRTLSP